jgi:hypothetical protein
MRQDTDLDQSIAWRAVAHRRAASALQTQNLAIPCPRRNAAVQGGAVGEGKRLLAAIHGIKKGKIEMIADI